jgi:hypothetical protein
MSFCTLGFCDRRFLKPVRQFHAFAGGWRRPGKAEAVIGYKITII